MQVAAMMTPKALALQKNRAEARAESAEGARPQALQRDRASGHQAVSFI